MTYVKDGVVMTRKRQALIMLYADKHRQLGYGPCSNPLGIHDSELRPLWARMPNEQYERYKEWVSGFLRPYHEHPQP